MLCALTVRRIKPGAFEQFAEAFRPPDTDEPPAGWVRFDMLRDTADENRVVTFGFFDGSRDELAFKHYLRRHQVPTHVWYSAYPRLSAANVARNEQIRNGLRGGMGREEAAQWLQLL
jgi:heme-degrading monooxygenase HmoA